MIVNSSLCWGNEENLWEKQGETSFLGIWLVYTGNYVYIYRIYLSGWWFFATPLKKWWSSSDWDDDIPNTWKNKIHVPNHQPVYIIEQSLKHINTQLQVSNIITPPYIEDIISIIMGIYGDNYCMYNIYIFISVLYIYIQAPIWHLDMSENLQYP